MTAPGAPLAGSIVVSVGHTLPGLYCVALLRDLGAEVVRVERVRRGDASDPYGSIVAAETSVFHGLSDGKMAQPAITGTVDVVGGWLRSAAVLRSPAGVVD